MTLRLTVALGGIRRDVEVEAGPQNTIGDLVRSALGHADPGWELEVDGERVDPSLLLTELRSGSTLEVDPVFRFNSKPDVSQVHLIGGFDAGRSFALPPGRHTLAETSDHRVGLVGGTPLARLDVGIDGLVRIWEAKLAVPAVPYSTRFGEPVMIGRIALRFSPPRNGRPRRGPHSRPPRPSPPDPPARTPLPAMPRPASPRPRIGWAALLAPIVMGGAFAAFLNPMMAIFALVGPLMLLAQWTEDRTGHRRRRAAEVAGLRSDTHLLRARLRSAAASESGRIRATHPDPAEIVERATSGHSSLWERRRGHDDFLVLSVGLGWLRWEPPIEPGGVGPMTPEIARVIEECSQIPLVPITIRLEPGSGAGVVGTGTSVLRVGIGLVAQAVVLHGPADIRLTLIVSPDRVERWDWLKWLPHLDPGAVSIIGEKPTDGQVRGPADSPRPTTGPVGRPVTGGPVDLVVVDIAGPLPEEARRAITPESALLFLTNERRHLPARCSTVVELDGAGARCASSAGPVRDVMLAAGTSADVAEGVARALAGLSDPDGDDETARLPERVSLLELIGTGDPTPEVIAARWAAAGSEPRITATLGVSEHGPVAVDLVADGPHGLVAGTTGSGKSELLRCFVISLALTVDPDHLVFVLMDYKGGSAFDACAHLPHVVGLVTDLDERLAMRALICLEAELRYREERLRGTGAADLGAYWSADPAEPMPRLLVVIDEFAALAAELPEFMTALLDIAQRGRSLGVHLLLATQRPAGVVSEGIKANTNIRIALRVHDQIDSTDVLGSPEAAFLGRRTPGRAYLRLGPADRVAFQTALVAEHAAATEHGPQLRSFSLLEPPPAPPPPTEGSPKDLSRLVSAIGAAAAGFPAPRRPWPPPLPDRIDRRELGPGGFAIADEPRRQSTRSMVHTLPSPLLLYGTRGSGTTTALVQLALSLAAVSDPDSLHIYVLDFDSQGLGPLAALPHTGAVIAAAERERQTRLLRFLSSEVERRRGAASSGLADSGIGGSRIVLLIDGFQGFCNAFDAPADLVWKEALTRLIADGPGFDVTVIATADRPGAVPGSVAGSVTNRLVFRLADPYDYAAFALRPPAGRIPPGRAIDTRTGLELQVACFDGTLESEVAAIAESTPIPLRRPASIGVLPSHVSAGELGRASFDGPDWLVPVGIGDDTLAPVNLNLAEGEPVLVAGSPKSGRSTTLMTIAQRVISSRSDGTGGRLRAVARVRHGGDGGQRPGRC